MSRTFLSLLLAGWLMLPGRAQAALQAGETAAVVADAEVKARPTSDSAAITQAPAGTAVTLIIQVSNTSGVWWYVAVDGKKGWLHESALAAPTEAAPAPQPAAAPAPTVIPTPAAEPTPAIMPAAEPVPLARDIPPKPRLLLTAAGSKELELDLDISKEKQSYDGFGSFDTSYTVLLLKYGYCATDHHEFGLLVSYVKISDDFFGSQTSYRVGPFYTLNLPSPPSKNVPFLGLAAAVSQTDFGSETADGRMIEATGGVRVFAGDDFSINIGAYYQRATLSDQGFDLKITSTGLRVGLSGFLR